MPGLITILDIQAWEVNLDNLKKLSDRKEELIIQKIEIEAELSALKKKITSTQDTKLTMTDHAYVRHLERVLKINVDQKKEKAIPQTVISRFEPNIPQEIIVNGIKYIIASNKIITIAIDK